MGGAIRALLAAAVACGTAIAPGQQPSGNDVIDGLKQFERSHGLPATGNFERRSEKAAASYRCYFSGKLELPASYDDLELRQGADCRIDESRYDVFYYAIQAVASGRSPLTPSLEEASLERKLMVVPHEDLHDAKELKDLPTAIAEAATTLMGFHTAAEFARERFGADSEPYRNLSREPELFLAKARIVNRYWEDLRTLYARVRAGRVAPREALAAKADAFARLREECSAIRPAPASFNACPAANNNAGLAFDATYTRYYPLLYELHVSLGRDLRTTLEALAPAARGRGRSEAEVAAWLRGLRAGRRSEKSSSTSGEIGNPP